MIARSTFDPFSLEQRRYPHEVRARDRFSTTMYVRKVPAGADLRAEFEAEMAYWTSSGWIVERRFKGSCFMHRGTHRWHLSLHPDPDYHGPPLAVESLSDYIGRKQERESGPP